MCLGQRGEVPQVSCILIMAEFVEFRAEEWIRELEYMERTRLFESSEVKSVATKRKQFEYKIERKSKCKEDFLKYIQFEIDLHKLIKARREKTKIFSNKVEIDFSQSRRIASLFKKVLQRFPNDIKLWMSFFQFCKEVKFLSLASQMLVRMLQIHMNKPELWAFAADWEKQLSSHSKFKGSQNKGIENARQFLTKGLRHHPSSEILYTELFKLELKHRANKKLEKERKLKKNKWIPDEVTDSIIDGKLLEIVFESSVKYIEGIDFKIKLLDIAKNVEETSDIQNKIFESIVKCHKNEELAWDAMAQRELEGIKCNLNELSGDNEPMDVDNEEEVENKSFKNNLQRCVNVYRKAVEVLNTKKMWSLYLDALIEIDKTVQNLPIFKFKLIRNGFEGAMSSGKMDEKYYIYWVKLLHKTGGKKKTLTEVLKKATEEHPKSTKLWHSQLRFHLSRDQETLGLSIFEEACKQVPDAVALWELVIQYLQKKSSTHLEEMFKKGIKQHGEVALVLKPMYIEYLVSTKGISEARKVFESLEMQHPPCLELYKKMISLELAQNPPCAENVRRCYELACTNFGTDSLDTWLEYIRFEKNHGSITRISVIYRRALKSLNPQLADEFIIKYNEIKINAE